MAASIKIPAVFTAKDSFSRTLKGIQRNVKGFSHKSQAYISAVDRRFNQTFNNLKYHALALGAALFASVRDANAFQKSMNNISTLVDTNIESMDKMGEEVLEISKEIPKNVDELTSSLYDIRSAGIDANDAMATLKTSGKLAVAGLSTTEESTNILTSAMNAFKKEGLESEQIADILFKTVKNGKTTVAALSQAFGANAGNVEAAGVSLADFSAATAALTTVGTPASQAQNQIGQAISKLQKPTSEMTKIFEELGVTSVNELIKREGGLVGAFDAIGSAGEGMGVNLAKAWGSTQALSAVTSLTGATKDVYLSTIDDMIDGNDALSEAFEKQMKSDANQLKLAENNMKALSITVGTQLAPVITSLTKMLTPVIQKFAEFIKNNQWLLKAILGVIGAIIGFKALIMASKAALGIYNVAMGIHAAITQTSRRRVIGNTVAQGAYRTMMIVSAVAMKAFTAAQWLLNAALTANPIGIIIMLIAGLIALVVLIIAKYDEWGASLALLLGPFGMIINVIQSFRRNWDMIVDAFKTGGIKAGIKAIGRVLIDALLMPMQQLLELVAKIPGMGDLAGNAAARIAAIRDGLGVNTGSDDESETEVLPTTNQASNEQLIERTNNSNVNLNIRDKGNNVESVEQDGNPIPINLGRGIGAFAT